MINGYHTYKKSKLDWFGEIPEKWHLISLKHLLEKVFGGGTPSTTNQEFWADDDYNNSIPWVAISDITKSNGVLYETSKRITQAGRDDNGLEILPKGTLLMSIFASLGKTTRLGIDATINQAILGLVPKPSLSLDFLEYLLVDAERYVSCFSSASTQENLNLTKIRNLQFPLPNIKEQTQIAQYLDYKTSIIDQLTHQKVKLIELLKEKRQAVINEAVTKGLNPNAKMKDSGIEWLGEVPVEWKLVNLKNLALCKNSTVDRHEYDEELKINICHYPYAYKNEKINSNTVLAKGTCTISEFENFCLKKGQVIITKDSESADDIGVPVYIEEDINNSVCGYHLTIIEISSNNILSEFLFRYVQSSQVSKYFELNSNGVTRYGLGKSKIENLKILIPNLEVQQAIIDIINQSCKSIDLLKSDLTIQIQKLKEYRQSIISEAVTGKIDVREWQPNKQVLA